MRELARDREPQARSVARPRPERTEDPLALDGADARARVRHGDGDRPVVLCEPESDAAAVGRPGEGVVEEVRDDLQQAIAVRRDDGIGADGALVVDTASTGLLREALVGLFEEEAK